MLRTKPGQIHERSLLELGFPPLGTVEGRLSIADLYPSPKRRCGIYALEHADGMLYIGQAVDVVRRFGQHRKTSNDIVRFTFFEAQRRQLDAEERRCIQATERLGLRLRNRMLVKHVQVDTDLDDVLGPDAQQEWLTRPSTSFASEPRLPLDPDRTQRMRFQPHFLRLQEDLAFEPVCRLLSRYVQACVPVARRTEQAFWSVSCLPATNRTHHPRWAAISMAEMEMSVVGWHPDDGTPWAFLNVSRAALGRRSSSRPLKRLGLEARQRRRGYRAAGGDDLTLEAGADSFSAMTQALSDPLIVQAARTLGLQVMRKRPNWYSKYHCFDLADRLL